MKIQVLMCVKFVSFCMRTAAVLEKLGSPSLAYTTHTRTPRSHWQNFHSILQPRRLNKHPNHPATETVATCGRGCCFSGPEMCVGVIKKCTNITIVQSCNYYKYHTLPPFSFFNVFTIFLFTFEK